MSLHKLTAGSGYDYLTRQVAAMDTTEKGHTTLASYYTEKGEVPGSWVGSGMDGIDGLAAGDVVNAEQMKALFAYGFHPLADARVNALGAGARRTAVSEARRLGTPYKVYDADIPPFQIEVARRIEDLNKAAGRTRNAEASIEERARVRSEVAREYFVREHGREPADARELAATVARHSRPRTTAVAGYDLTFSPVKSVSTLWAVADPAIAARIERAHNAAVGEALEWIEREALYTRTGTNGVRQVDVRGLVGAAFTHRDSRAGDPDLHTHVAIANKVQTADDAGRWLAIDGRILYKATIAASERYNTALEKHLSDDLGLRFAERPSPGRRKRPVREIVGVDPKLAERWSSRRASIAVRKAELTVAFQAAHGRPPTPVEAIQLAQQATLETRDAKHEPRSVTEQRQTWEREAIDTLGSAERVRAMVQSTLSSTAPAGDRVDAEWIARCARTVLEQVQQRRATWQVWHLTAEAQRQVRRGAITAAQVDTVAALVVDAAVSLSEQITTNPDPISDPDPLRRRDGSSVYTVAGVDLFTSADIIAAERRIVTNAGRFDGRSVAPETVDLVLLESAANGVELNAGQSSMVRGMATSRARVQVGIAAAGTGKTTAMSALTRAWEEDGGTVLGLAPSAAAAAALREETGTTTDTLAKLLVDLERGPEAGLAGSIGAETLVVIDESGMADTLSLDAAITHALSRGASVRLIGDDQQLAAIGAGGVLRDVVNQHGALRLTELMRFADPAEGAATLALREGLPEAIGFYLDRQRVHVGDLGTLTHDVFTAWCADQSRGHDSIMLAPTRDLVADLNARARTARVADGSVSDAAAARLSDGNGAGVGDIVLTRENNRRLRISATDWVKNGDRWVVTAVENGALTVRHAESGLRLVLPDEYVREHTELGYASTVHTAQGVSVDTAHAVVTGDEARQQFYTAMTRGRHANHAYLITASDGDQHSMIRPETIRPTTATDMLEAILARDGAPKSATTMAREAVAAETQLGHAVARYTDALYVGAEHIIGPETTASIEDEAAILVPGIADEPAWPVLRAHLVLRQAQGHDALADLADAVAARALDGVEDRAALLDWRLDPTGLRGAEAGPLPWLPAVPAALANHPTWGPYLEARADRVSRLVSDVSAAAATAETPAWARQGGARPAAGVLGAVAVWRAAAVVDADDRRPTGRAQLQKAAAAYQRGLDERLSAGRSPALAEWGALIDELHPRRDAFTQLLAERLAAMSRAGLDAAGVFRAAATEGPLPDDHVAAAMWWRISRHLSPTVAASLGDHDGQVSARWSDLLIDQVGVEPAAEIMGSPWWPTLVSAVDHAVQRGWRVSELIDLARTVDLEDVDQAQAMVWRVAIITDPPAQEADAPPAPIDDDLTPPEDLDEVLAEFDSMQDHPAAAPDALAEAARERGVMVFDTTDNDNARQWERGMDVLHSPVSVARILQINEAAGQFYEGRFADSWADAHLRQRLGVDLAGDRRFRPGYAPAGWTQLVDHLRAGGFRDDELLAAGVAKTASTGQLIDRFRDRAILPVITDGHVLGFVGRRKPDDSSEKAGPKYLNSPDTIVFHKGAQLYGLADPDMIPGSRPVLVEGPLDALAVTVSSGGAWIGVAPLGTSLTDEQASQLAGFDSEPVIATDGDTAGRIAAERDHWLLAPHQVEPAFVSFEPGDDPASLLQNRGPAALVAALQSATPLRNALLDERLANIEDRGALAQEVAVVIASQPTHTWEDSIDRAGVGSGVPPRELRDLVADRANAFTSDPQRFIHAQLDLVRHVRARIEHSIGAASEVRWAPLARTLDARLTQQPDWPATAQILQQLHDAGADVAQITQDAIAPQPLDDRPGQDLRYRLVAHLEDSGLPLTPAPNAPVAPPRPEDHPSSPIQPPRRGPHR